MNKLRYSPPTMIDEMHKQYISQLRRSVKELGGVRMKIETLSWGQHVSFFFAGPGGAEHRAGNIAPLWWTDEHMEKFQKLIEICNTTREQLAKIGEKLPGLLH